MAFNQTAEIHGNVAVIKLFGELDAAAAPTLREKVDEIATSSDISKLILDVKELSYMASAGLRALVFAKQKMGQDVSIYIAGAQEPVAETIELTGFHHSVIMLEDYDINALTQETSP